MTERGNASAGSDVAINADADAVYRLITDLNTLATLAEENESMAWRKGDKATRGAVFKGTNRNGSHRCLLYTSDAADELDGVDLGGRRIIKKIF